MISDFPHNTKILIVSIITAVFVSSVIFAYIMFTDPSVSDDGSKAIMYATVFAIVLIALNVLLLVVALRASKKLKAAAATKKCASCGTVIDRASAECPECRSVQVNDDTYLEPKRKEKVIKPKAKRP